MRCDYRNEDDVRCTLLAAFEIEGVLSCTDHLTPHILLKIGNKPGEAVNVIRMRNDFL